MLKKADKMSLHDLKDKNSKERHPHEGKTSYKGDRIKTKISSKITISEKNHHARLNKLQKTQFGNAYSSLKNIFDAQY